MSWIKVTADAVLNPLLGPLLDLPPIGTILLISLFVSGVSVLFQKYLTDQKKMKDFRARMKKLQEQMKKVRDDPKKAMKLQKELMGLQMPMMKESFKPVLWTMIPFMLLFLWLAAHFAYLPLLPGQEFTLTADVRGIDTLALRATPELTIAQPTVTVVGGKATWTLSGEAGTYLLEILGQGETPIATKKVLITEERSYETPQQRYDGPVSMVTVGNQPLKPLGNFSLFGWRPGWLAVYITFSIITSMLLRKLLDVA